MTYFIYSMSYDSFISIWHFMSYDAYDIKIWYQSIRSILESKETSGAQEMHLLIRFKMKNLKWIFIFSIHQLKNKNLDTPSCFAWLVLVLDYTIKSLLPSVSLIRELLAASLENEVDVPLSTQEIEDILKYACIT